MRRPIVYITLFFVSGIVIAFYTVKPILTAAVFISAAVLMLLIKFILKKQGISIRIYALLLCISLLGSMMFQCCYNSPRQLHEYVGSETVISGIVVSAEQRDDEYFKSVIRVDENEEIGRLKGEELVALSIYGELGDISVSDMVGRRLTVSAKLELPAQRRNPKTFDYRLYLKTKGIYTVASCNAAAMDISADKEDAFANRISNGKAHFEALLNKSTGKDTAALVMAMMFGEKNQLDEDTYEAFQKNGTAHVLAVSGLHMGIIYAFFNFLWRGRKGTVFSIVMILFMFVFAAMASFSPSVVRAVIMITMHIVAKLLHRPYDLLSAGAFSALIMLLINPLQLFNVGFQLSYLAILILSAIIPFGRSGISGKLLVMFGIQIVMAPFTAYTFNYFSLGGFLVNMPIMFLAGLMIPVGVSLLLLSFFGLSFINDPAFAACGVFLDTAGDIMIRLNEIVYKQGVTSFDVVSPSIPFLILFYGSFFFFSSEMCRIFFLRKQWGKVMRGAVLILLTVVISLGAQKDDFVKAQIVFVDVGQGDCILVNTPGDRHYLFDGGGNANYDVGKKTLRPYLLKNGIRKIDVAFVTHLHRDHYDGIRSLAKQGMIKRLCTYSGNVGSEKNIANETGLSPKNILYVSKGDRVNLAANVYAEILWPGVSTGTAGNTVTETSSENRLGESSDENSSSLIFKLQYRGTSLLVTGDIDADGEKKLIEDSGNALQSDILKVAHHGSRYSSCDEFVQTVSPRVAVFQVGKNTYGHPSPEVTKKFTTIYRNDTQGAIGVFGLDDAQSVKDIYIKTVIKNKNTII